LISGLSGTGRARASSRRPTPLPGVDAPVVPVFVPKPGDAGGTSGWWVTFAIDRTDSVCRRREVGGRRAKWFRRRSPER
jgi:hypothetical protein